MTSWSSWGNQRPTGGQKMKFKKKGFENRRLIIYNDLFGICLGNRKLHSKICIQSGEKSPSTRRAETGLSRLSLALRLSRFARKVMTWFANSSWSQLQLAHHVISSHHCNLASTCINLHFSPDHEDPPLIKVVVTWVPRVGEWGDTWWNCARNKKNDSVGSGSKIRRALRFKDIKAKSALKHGCYLTVTWCCKWVLQNNMKPQHEGIMPTLWDKDGKVTKGYQKATLRVQNTHPLSPLANIKGFLHFDRGILMYFVAIVVFWVKLRPTSGSSYQLRFISTPPRAQDRSRPDKDGIQGEFYVVSCRILEEVELPQKSGLATQLPFFTTRLMLLMQKAPAQRMGNLKKSKPHIPPPTAKLTCLGCPSADRLVLVISHNVKLKKLSKKNFRLLVCSGNWDGRIQRYQALYLSLNSTISIYCAWHSPRRQDYLSGHGKNMWKT